MILRGALGMSSEQTGSDFLLIAPPFADPTWPYVSLPTLKGYLAQRGIGVTVRDWNLEGLYFLTDGATTEGWRRQLSARLAELNSRERLTLIESMEYRRVAEALPLFADFAAALKVLRDRARFYERASYVEARDCLEDLFRIVEALCFPFRFHFNRADHLMAPWDFALLDRYIQERRSPLDAFYRRQLAGLAEPPRFVGVSLTFVSQLPEAFYLCHLVRELFPDCFVMLGGPCADLMIRHGRPEAVAGMLDRVDAVCMQEGEKTLEQLLPLLDAGQRPSPADLAGIANLVSRDPASGVVQRGPSWILDLADSAAPDYSDLDLSRYPAPSSMLLYSPTRGCYWNKCSFCGYGFNQSGAHAYREIPVRQAVAGLRELQERYGVSNFYFSCDVLAPDYAFRLAREIIATGLEIRWSTDLRIEEAYTAEGCQLLHRAGLRAVAFGVESCSQKVLDLMRKGVTPGRIRRVNRLFHQAGIATAWMTFLGHPGEKGKDARATLKMLEDEGRVVDQFIVGSFGLTPGSRIACQPAEFGLDGTFFTAGDIFGLFPLPIPGGEGVDETGMEELDARIAALSARYQLDHYPWAGAISTHHSFLYLLRHGQRIFAAPWPLDQKRKRKRQERPLRLRFSLDRLRRREERFIGAYLQEALEPDPATGLTPLCYQHFQQALDSQS